MDARRQDAGEGSPEVSITPYKDGPYLVRGPVRLSDPDGRDLGNGRRVIALCRCGKSRIRPLCDGTHKLTNFTAPGTAEAWPPEQAR